MLPHTLVRAILCVVHNALVIESPEVHMEMGNPGAGRAGPADDLSLLYGLILLNQIIA